MNVNDVNNQDSRGIRYVYTNNEIPGVICR